MAPISLRSVAKSYGRNAVVHGVSLDIDAGEFIVILGPSGCGKSTLLRMIAGLEEITGGDILIDQEIVNRKEPRERACAMVFQNYALYPHMSVADNIGYALKVAGVPKKERKERVEKVAASLALDAYLDRKPAALSGGQRQRVAMGRAMIREPKVFLFDEPLSNLDARLRISMRVEIRRLHKRLGTTSIFVTHDQHEAMTLADRIIVMNAGHIEQVGTPEEIYHKPATRFVAGFVGSPAMNLIEGTLHADGVMRSASGLAFAVPQDLAGRAGAGKIVLGIRAEDIRLAPADLPGAIAATVEVIEELGANRVIHCEAAGAAFAVALNEQITLRAGDKTGLIFDPAKIHLFHAESGKRID